MGQIIPPTHANNIDHLANTKVGGTHFKHGRGFSRTPGGYAKSLTDLQTFKLASLL